MAIPRVKSRIQFQGRYKQAAQRNKHHAEPQKPKQTDNIACSPGIVPKVYTFSIESDDPIYEDYIEPFEEEDPSFSKRQVSTTEENEMSGAFKSQFPPAEVISTALSRSDSPDSCHSSMDTDSDSSDSLLIQVPLYVLDLEEYERAPRNQPKPTVEENKANHSPRSWQEWIVDLFAGRRRSSSRRSSKSNASSTASRFVIVEPVTPPPETNSKQEDSNHHTTTPHQPKRLPLPQIIPSICVATPDHPSQRPNYREIPPALPNPYTGYAVVAEDAFSPDIIERGFATSESSLPFPRLFQRHNNSAKSLLDRHGDAWALWSEKTVTPDDLPFARRPAESRICVETLLHPLPAERRGTEVECRRVDPVRIQSSEWPWVC